MKMKDFIKDLVTSYFITVTLICFVMFVLGMIFEPDRKFGYEAFLSPLLYALFSMIPTAVLYSKKEYGAKQLIIRKVIQLICIEAIILFIICNGSKTNTDISRVISLAVAIAIIYILVIVIGYMLDSKQAAEMNKYLLLYQELNEE